VYLFDYSGGERLRAPGGPYHESVPVLSHHASGLGCATGQYIRLFHPAESPASGEARLIRTHPQPDVLLGLLFDMVA
jgi:hypothetical protein